MGKSPPLVVESVIDSTTEALEQNVELALLNEEREKMELVDMNRELATLQQELQKSPNIASGPHHDPNSDLIIYPNPKSKPQPTLKLKPT